MSGDGDHTSEYPVVFFIFVTLAAGVFARHILSRTRIPYTIIMFLIGVGFGEVARALPSYHKYVSIADIDPDLFLFIFLPILIFESAFSMDVHTFRIVFWQCALLAGPGLCVAATLTGLVVWGFYGDSMNPVACLFFGAILSATDPVAVVALLKELGASKKISTIIEGESLLNDGVAIVFFSVLIEAVPFGVSHLPSVWMVLFSLVRFVVGGVILGLVMAHITVWMLRRMFNEAVLEITITLSSAYITFFIAEAYAGVSGVIALVVLGVYLSHRRAAISPEAVETMHEFWETIVYMTNTLIFTIVGVQIEEKATHHYIVWKDYLYLAVLYICVNVIRFLIVFAALPVLQRFQYRIDWKAACLVSWGGLRGAVGLALALIVENSLARFEDGAGLEANGETAARIAFHTAGIVMLTLVVNGITTQNVVAALGLNAVPADRRVSMARAVQLVADEEVKVVKVLQTDRVVADSNWDVVRLYTIKRIRNPHDTKEPLVVDTFDRARRMYLRLFQQVVWKMHEEGILGFRAVRVLSGACDSVQEEYGEFFDAEVLTRFWLQPSWWKVLIRIPVLHLYATKEVEAHMASGYDIGTGFVMASEEVLHHLDHLINDRDHVAQIRSRIEVAMKQVLVRMHLMAREHPDIALAKKTKQAARLVLNSARHCVETMKEECEIEEGDAAVLIAAVEAQMHRVHLEGTRLQPPDTEGVLKSVVWYKSESFITQTGLQKCAQLEKAAEGSTIIAQGTVPRGLHLVASGIVRVEHGTHVSFFGPGRCVAVDGVLTGAEASESVIAQSEVMYFLFPTRNVQQLMRTSPSLSDSLWKIFGRHMAYLTMKQALPYILWGEGRLKMHCEEGYILRHTGKPQVLVPATEHVLLHGEVTTARTRTQFVAPCLVLTSEACHYPPEARIMAIPSHPDHYVERMDALSDVLYGGGGTEDGAAPAPRRGRTSRLGVKEDDAEPVQNVSFTFANKPKPRPQRAP